MEGGDDESSNGGGEMEKERQVIVLAVDMDESEEEELQHNGEEKEEEEGEEVERERLLHDPDDDDDDEEANDDNDTEGEMNHHNHHHRGSGDGSSIASSSVGDGSGVLEEGYSLDDLLVPVGQQSPRSSTPPPPLPPRFLGQGEGEENGKGGGGKKKAMERLEKLKKQVDTEIEDRKNRYQREEVTAASSSSPEEEERNGEERALSSLQQREGAILRGLDFIYQLACNKSNFVVFGADVIMCLFDLATQAGQPSIRRAALQRAEILGQQWKETFPTLKSIAKQKIAFTHKEKAKEDEKEEGEEGDNDTEMELDGEKERPEQKKKKKKIKLDGEEEDGEMDVDDAKPDTDDINTAIRGACLLIRLGFSAASLIEEIKQFIEEEGYTAKDFVGFDPRKRPVSLPKARPAHNLAEAIDVMFYAERVGVDLGGSTDDVLPLLKELRPYRSCEECGWDDWEDQFILINNILHVCSYAGELRLQPALFPHEYALLRDRDTLKWSIEVNDCQLIGDICHCLAIFGHHSILPSTTSTTDDLRGEDGSSLLHQGRHYLLQHQSENGSWPLRDHSTEPYDLFLASNAAVAGLLDLQPKGYGPSTVHLADTLRKINTEQDLPLTPSSAFAAATASTSNNNNSKRRKIAPPSVTCCGQRRPLVLKKFDGLADLYRISAGVAVELTGGIEDHDANDPEPADYRIGGVSLRQLTDLSLKGKATKTLTEMLYWREKGAGKGRRDLRSPVEGEEGSSGSESKAQQVQRKRAATKGLGDKGEFNRLYTTLCNTAAAANGSSSPRASATGGGAAGAGMESGGATRVSLGTARLDLFDLFQAVGAKGGAAQIIGLEGWQTIAKEINVPTSVMERARRLKDLYEKTLASFEEWWAEEFEAKGKRMELQRYVREQRALLPPRKASGRPGTLGGRMMEAAARRGGEEERGGNGGGR